MEEQERLNIKSQVHVLNTEVSHLQARLDRVHQELSEENDATRKDIEDIVKRVDALEERAKDLKKWVGEEVERREKQEEIQRKKDLASWRARRNLWIAIISAVVGAIVTGFITWFFGLV
jgi:hypothetical protein